MFAPEAMNKGLALEVENRADAFVITDKERILQIGNNLLSNAIKFTENGYVSLLTEYRDGMLALTVEDTGTGMTDEEQQRVFGAFERLSNAATQDRFRSGPLHRAPYRENARRQYPRGEREREKEAVLSQKYPYISSKRRPCRMWRAMPDAPAVPGCHSHRQ